MTSPNVGLRARAFRNYADYMLTPEFEKAARAVMDLATRRRVAIMCAERFFWRCHRKLISDYLTAHGAQVIHIVDLATTRIHTLSHGAVVRAGKLTYPAP